MADGGYRSKSTKDSRNDAEAAFGGAEKPGFFARLMGRGTKGGIPSSPSGSTTSVSVTPRASANVSPLGGAQASEAASTTDAMGGDVNPTGGSTDAMGGAVKRPTFSQASIPAPPPAPRTYQQGMSPPPAVRRVTSSSSSSVNVAPIIRTLVILGVVIYAGISIFSAVDNTTKKIKFPSFTTPSFPGVTTPITPPTTDPSSGGSSNYFAGGFAGALKTARSRVDSEATFVAIRLDSDRATFVLQGSDGQKIVTIAGGSVTVLGGGGASGGSFGGVSLSRVNPAAPRNIVARLKSRFGVAPSDVDYLAAVGNKQLGGVLWTAHTTQGDTYTADVTGTKVKAPPG